MKVKEMVETLDRDLVIGALFHFYPDQMKNHDGYEEAWADLLKTEAIPTSGTIMIRYISEDYWEDPDFVPYYDVYGIFPDSEDTWAIEYRPWGEWMDEDVGLAEGCPDLSDIEKMAHCLFEITWSGYTNKDVQDHAKEMFDYCDKAIEQIKNEELD